MGYQTDKDWSDSKIEAVKTIVGPHLLRTSTFFEDTKQAADLLVLRAGGITVACRSRRSRYAGQFPDQFTIRTFRPSGAKTEYQKILEGWGDWFFYGHDGDSNAGFDPWWLIDLNCFRCQVKTGKVTPREEKLNPRDGTKFFAFWLRDFKPVPPLLVAQSQKPEPPPKRPPAIVTPEPKQLTFF